MSKKNIHIGVDLGTTSIGLSVIDDQCNVIYKPQIIHFPDISDEKTGNCYNKNRRSHRLYRRQLSRYKYRLKCFKNLIMEHFSLDDNQYLCDINETFKGENLYETRKELLEKNIPCENKTKFIKMLYLYLKHRGSYHVIDQFDVKNFPSNRIFCDEKLRFNDISHND
jgi:CRISPR/Cas system Type II protein with McrA/HNH and RuvC-like nuclease domain